MNSGSPCMRRRKGNIMPLAPFELVKPMMKTGIKKSYHFPSVTCSHYTTGHDDKMLIVMFGCRCRWLIGRLVQLLASLGLLFFVNEAVGVAISRSEVRSLGLVVVVIFGIALPFKVPRTVLYLLCVLLVLCVSKSE
ncbi:hypothetical protein AVEN_195453-1 [Araneus ventricosus]|uniref:Transmembrane protein n=1 Tax=Araneus ventricosus TaxID=182803 RepID=A0A4Y2VRE0_ARAVE|nr:hypothetical protein AVEN_195453-1 [Araneus ventricosus]